MLKRLGLLALIAGRLVPAPAARAETVAERFAGGIRLRVTRSLDRHGEPTERRILLEEWLEYVEREPQLRRRTKSRQGRNPVTGKPIEIRVAEGSSEILVDGYPLPFFFFGDGELELYVEHYPQDADDPVLKAVSAVARHFEAVITVIDSDEIVEW